MSLTNVSVIVVRVTLTLHHVNKNSLTILRKLHRVILAEINLPTIRHSRAQVVEKLANRRGGRNNRLRGRNRCARLVHKRHGRGRQRSTVSRLHASNSLRIQVEQLTNRRVVGVLLIQRRVRDRRRLRLWFRLRLRLRLRVRRRLRGRLRLRLRVRRRLRGRLRRVRIQHRSLRLRHQNVHRARRGIKLNTRHRLDAIQASRRAVSLRHPPHEHIQRRVRAAVIRRSNHTNAAGQSLTRVSVHNIVWNLLGNNPVLNR